MGSEYLHMMQVSSTFSVCRCSNISFLPLFNSPPSPITPPTPFTPPFYILPTQNRGVTIFLPSSPCFSLFLIAFLSVLIIRFSTNANLVFIPNPIPSFPTPPSPNHCLSFPSKTHHHHLPIHREKQSPLPYICISRFRFINIVVTIYL